MYTGSLFDSDEIEDVSHELVLPSFFGQFDGLGSSMVEYVNIN
jgi:hypothetical protein